MKSKTLRLVKTAVLSALALITFMIENLLPPLLAFAPGTKLGLASVFVNLALIIYGEREAFIVLAVKCLLGSLFAGNVFSLYYSVPAGILSLLCASILTRFALKRLGIVSISAVCAAVHNIVQIIMASILLGTPQIVYYISLASVAGIIAGTLTGLALYFTVKYLPLKILEG